MKVTRQLLCLCIQKSPRCDHILKLSLLKSKCLGAWSKCYLVMVSGALIEVCTTKLQHNRETSQFLFMSHCCNGVMYVIFQNSIFLKFILDLLIIMTMHSFSSLKYLKTRTYLKTNFLGSIKQEGTKMWRCDILMTSYWSALWCFKCLFVW